MRLRRKQKRNLSNFKHPVARLNRISKMSILPSYLYACEYIAHTSHFSKAEEKLPQKIPIGSFCRGVLSKDMQQQLTGKADISHSCLVRLMAWLGLAGFVVQSWSNSLKKELANASALSALQESCRNITSWIENHARTRTYSHTSKHVVRTTSYVALTSRLDLVVKADVCEKCQLVQL